MSPTRELSYIYIRKCSYSLNRCIKTDDYLLWPEPNICCWCLPMYCGYARQDARPHSAGLLSSSSSPFHHQYIDDEEQFYFSVSMRINRFALCLLVYLFIYHRRIWYIYIPTLACFHNNTKRIYTFIYG